MNQDLLQRREHARKRSSGPKQRGTQKNLESTPQQKPSPQGLNDLQSSKYRMRGGPMDTPYGRPTPQDVTSSPTHNSFVASTNQSPADQSRTMRSPAIVMPLKDHTAGTTMMASYQVSRKASQRHSAQQSSNDIRSRNDLIKQYHNDRSEREKGMAGSPLKLNSTGSTKKIIDIVKIKDSNLAASDNQPDDSTR